MDVEKKSSFFFIGLALFAMFFGSGNLIFPLDVGRVSQEGWPIASTGFLLTAGLVPFLGVIAMVVFRGHTQEFFSILGKPLGLALTALILTVWIPLGSGPRCIVLAYSSMATVTAMPSLWLFSLVWSVLVWFVVYQKSRMLDILGYILTPLLLVCLSLIVYFGLQFASSAPETTLSPFELFYIGAKEGYNTMDLIASFFFSASIIEILRGSAHHGSYHPLKITLKAGVIGVGLLSIVYLGLISIAALNSETLTHVPKDQLLATVARKIMGSEFSVVAVTAIFLACFTTAVALAIVFSEFLNRFIGNEKLSMVLTLVVTFAMSLTGLAGITALTGPILQAFYPMLILLIIYNLTRHFCGSKCKLS